MGRTQNEKEEAVEYWKRPHGTFTRRVDGVKQKYNKNTPVPFPKGTIKKGDWVRCGEAPAVEEQEETTPTTGLVLEPKGGGWYNVLNGETGEPINDVGLKLEAAEALIAEMSGDEDPE